MLSASKWLTVKRVKTSRAGKFRASISHESAGTFTYRWRVEKTKAAVGAGSKRFTYTVKAKPVDNPNNPVDPPANPDTSGHSFSFVAIGDTQNEVLSSSGASKFSARTQWIVNNKASENIRYVMSTGDFSNWGWLDQAQYSRGKAAMDKLSQAGIKYSISEGNHDTRAVGWNGVAGSRGYGGTAYVGNPECVERLSAAECKTELLVRKSDEFNMNFTPGDFGAVGGMFTAGDLENSYSTFTEDNTKWLVLNLELWPRTSVVNWAKTVLASYSDYNVVIQTHSYLEGDGSVSTSNGGYGANSPRYVYDNLVAPYSNVKMVFSGHTGALSSRSDKPNGNKVLSYVGNESGSSAATRIVTVYTDTGTVKTRAYIGGNLDYSGPATSETLNDGMVFIK